MTEMALKRRSTAGCGYILIMCASTCLLLILNAALVVASYERAVPFAPTWFGHPRVAQVLLFAGPVFLILIEWYIYDWLSDRWQARSDSKSRPQASSEHDPEHSDAR